MICVQLACAGLRWLQGCVSFVGDRFAPGLSPRPRWAVSFPSGVRTTVKVWKPRSASLFPCPPPGVLAAHVTRGVHAPPSAGLALTRGLAASLTPPGPAWSQEATPEAGPFHGGLRPGPVPPLTPLGHHFPSRSAPWGDHFSSPPLHTVPGACWPRPRAFWVPPPRPPDRLPLRPCSSLGSWEMKDRLGACLPASQPLPRLRSSAQTPALSCRRSPSLKQPSPFRPAPSSSSSVTSP